MYCFLAIFNGILFDSFYVNLCRWNWRSCTRAKYTFIWLVPRCTVLYFVPRCTVLYFVLRCTVLYFILVYSRHEPGLGIWFGLVWDMEMSRCPGINGLDPQPLCDLCWSLLGDHRSIRISNQNEWKVKTLMKKEINLLYDDFLGYFFVIPHIVFLCINLYIKFNLFTLKWTWNFK